MHILIQQVWGGGLRFCISNQFLSATNAANLQTILQSSKALDN